MSYIVASASARFAARSYGCISQKRVCFIPYPLLALCWLSAVIVMFRHGGEDLQDEVCRPAKSRLWRPALYCHARETCRVHAARDMAVRSCASQIAEESIKQAMGWTRQDSIGRPNVLSSGMARLG